ncbi:MAG: KH domain-containing protein [Lachnospiraceae bacterium]|nr:KH domain-containing protein [Lachnospiraceae bacterium]MEE3461309.1 KH domain-containing protein [Lachnospiraceae bacterium]
MEELVRVLAGSLVDEPDKVKVEKTEDDNEIVIHLFVAENDMGKVIGKGGRIAKAIRTLVKASAYNTDKKVFVEIGE